MSTAANAKLTTRAIGLTRPKISCRESAVHEPQHTLPTADTPSVNRRLARGQLDRLVRCHVSLPWAVPSETLPKRAVKQPRSEQKPPGSSHRTAASTRRPQKGPMRDASPST